MELVETDEFQRWLRGLRDKIGLDRINARLARVRLGPFGDSESVGSGVSEMRIEYGPSYRVYYTRVGVTVVVLLCGVGKDSQPRDIRRARQVAADWRAGNA